MATTKKPRRTSTLGTIYTNSAGTFLARYDRNGRRHTPSHGFPSFKLADDWLAAEQLLIARDEWTPPAQRRAEADAATQVATLTFGVYAEQWVANRQVKGRALRPRTAEHYRRLLASWLQPFANTPVSSIDRAMVAAWYRKLDPEKKTMRSHAYALFRSIMATAVKDGLVDRNPVDIHGASAKPTPAQIELFTPAQINDLADLMPPQHRVMVLLAAWCGFRFGELCALRRCDVTINKAGNHATIRVERAVVSVNHKRVLGPPKSDAGTRTVVVPPHIIDDLKTHLKTWAQWGADGLLFPPTNPAFDFLTPGQFYGHKPVISKTGKVIDPGKGWYLARHQIGKDDLSFHKLRHFASTNYMIAGASEREVGGILGQSDMSVVKRYQHLIDSRRDDLAARMSELAKLDGEGL